MSSSLFKQTTFIWGLEQLCQNINYMYKIDKLFFLKEGQLVKKKKTQWRALMRRESLQQTREKDDDDEEEEKKKKKVMVVK